MFRRIFGKKKEVSDPDPEFDELNDYFKTIKNNSELRRTLIEGLYSRFTNEKRLNNIKEKLKKKYPKLSTNINFNFNTAKATIKSRQEVVNRGSQLIENKKTSQTENKGRLESVNRRTQRTENRGTQRTENRGTQRTENRGTQRTENRGTQRTENRRTPQTENRGTPQTEKKKIIVPTQNILNILKSQNKEEQLNYIISLWETYKKKKILNTLKKLISTKIKNIEPIFNEAEQKYHQKVNLVSELNPIKEETNGETLKSICKRLEKEEPNRKRLEKEEANRKRLEKEEANRKRLEKEEANRKRLEKEEANRNQLEKEEANRKKSEKYNKSKLNTRIADPLRLINFAVEFMLRKGLKNLDTPENLYLYFPFRDYIFNLRNEIVLPNSNCLISRQNSQTLEPQAFLNRIKDRVPPYRITNVSGDGHCSVWAFMFGYFMNNNNFQNTRLEPFLNIAQTYISIINDREFNHNDFKPNYILLAMHFYFLWVGRYYFDIFLQIENPDQIENPVPIQNKFLNYLPYLNEYIPDINDLINFELTHSKGEIAVKTYLGFLIVSKVFGIEQIMITPNDQRNNVLQFFITAHDALTRNVGTVDYIIFNYLSFLLDTPYCLYKLTGISIDRNAAFLYSGNIENIKEKINIYGSGAHFFSINSLTKYQQFIAQNRNKEFAILWFNNMKISRNRLMINYFSYT